MPRKVLGSPRRRGWGPEGEERQNPKADKQSADPQETIKQGQRKAAPLHGRHDALRLSATHLAPPNQTRSKRNAPDDRMTNRPNGTNRQNQNARADSLVGVSRQPATKNNTARSWPPCPTHPHIAISPRAHARFPALDLNHEHVHHPC